jgi:polyhydroxyalkanoate synthesis repressor PhaR
VLLVADQGTSAGAAPIVVKKYANRRLYNTSTSTYVTLDRLSEMVKTGVDFVVQDAKSGDDITRAVLTQIIFEQENRGQNLLPVQFLRRLIRFYGDSMQGFLPSYLEMSMERFTAAQDQWRDQMSKAWGGKTPIGAFEEQARANLAMFDQALRLWAPFASAPPSAATPPPSPKEEPPQDAVAISDLKKQMELMQKQLDLLAKAGKPEK